MLRQWSATNWEALPSHEGEQLKKDSQHAWCVGDFDGLQFLLSTVCEEEICLPPFAPWIWFLTNDPLCALLLQLGLVAGLGTVSMGKV